VAPTSSSSVGWTSQVTAPSSPSPLNVALLGCSGVDLGSGGVDLGGGVVAVCEGGGEVSLGWRWWR